MRKITKGTAKDEVTYFFLISNTEKGTMQSTSQRNKGANDVTRIVRKEGGECRLFATGGAACDYVSVITGVSTAGAIRIAAEIGRGGAVQATLVSGVEVFGAR